MVTILKEIDQNLSKRVVSGEKFKEYFFSNCKCKEIEAYIRSIVE